MNSGNHRRCWRSILFLWTCFCGYFSLSYIHVAFIHCLLDFDMKLHPLSRHSRLEKMTTSIPGTVGDRVSFHVVCEAKHYQTWSIHRRIGINDSESEGKGKTSSSHSRLLTSKSCCCSGHPWSWFPHHITFPESDEGFPLSTWEAGRTQKEIDFPSGHTFLPFEILDTTSFSRSCDYRLTG
jgi:hypothetical protein